MSLGILGDRRRKPPRPTAPARYAFKKQLTGMGALGATDITIPSNCWDVTGFKDCNTQGWNDAETKCRQSGQPTALATASYGGDVDACKSDQAAQYAYYGCAMRLCPPAPATHPLTSGGWTWMSPTPNPEIKTFQDHINQAIVAEGYKPITADGKLGPATCGAFNFVDTATYGSLFASDPTANIGICQSFTNPTKVGSTTPVPSPTSAEAQKLDQQFGGLPWLQADSRVAALQAQINQALSDNGFLPIPVSGKLDPATCGAMTWLDQNTGSRWMASWGPTGGGACPSMVMPIARPVATTAPKAAQSSSALAPSATQAAPSSSSSLALVGGLLAAAVVGGVAYWKHKTGGA